MALPIATVTAVLVAIAMTSLVVAWLSLKSRPEDGAVSFAAVAMSLSLWSFAAGMHYTVPVGTHDLWMHLYVLVAPITCITWFAFALIYAGHKRWFTPTRIGVLSLAYLAHLLILGTNPAHALLYEVSTATAGAGMPAYDFGSYFYAFHVGYAGLAMVGSLALLLQGYRTRNVYRQINFMLGVGGVSIVTAAMVNVAALTPTPLMADPALVFGFWTVVAIGSYYSIAVYNLLPVNRLLSLVSGGSSDLVPMGRDFVVEDLDDGFMILDRDRRVVDINATVKRHFGREIVGAKIDSIRPLMEAVDGFEGGDDLEQLNESVWRPPDDADRFYTFRVTAIRDEAGDEVGSVIILRDVTTAKRREIELREREEELELLKDTMSRFLRHNIRNDLNVVQGYADLLREKHPEDEEALSKIVDVSRKVMDRSQKARTLEKVIENNDTAVENVAPHIKSVVQEKRSAHPDANITTDLPEELWVRTIPYITTAVDNLIENAIEHNPSEEMRVEVSARMLEEWVEVVVSDNGPGIGKQEIDVLYEEEETSLQHSSGLGLWVVNWVVSKSDGEFEVQTDEGSTVILRLERGHPVTAAEGVSESVET